MPEIKEVKEVKTEFYRVKEFAPVERNGQVLNRNPRVVEQGGIFEAGDVIELTSERMKQLGEDSFEKLNEKEHKEWVESKHTKKFLNQPSLVKK